MNERYQRFDYGKLMKPFKTEEGYMLMEGVATRTGIFEYMRVDGSIQRELRLAEEVANIDSLTSLARKPVTLFHPEEMVNPKNVGEHQVGDVDSEVVYDTASGFVKVKVAVRRADAIEAVSRGIRELSCGYTCDLEFSPGEWEGQSYDAIQRKIVHNHLAIVPMARGGNNVRLRADSNDAVITDEHSTGQAATKEKRTMGVEHKNMASVEIGGVRFDGLEPELAKSFKSELTILEGQLAQVKTDAAAQAEAAKAELEKVKGELEAKAAKIDEFEKKKKEEDEEEDEEKKEEGKKKEDAVFLDKFNERLTLLALAAKVKVEDAHKMDALALKRAIVKARRPKLENVEQRVDAWLDGFIADVQADMLNECNLSDVTKLVAGFHKGDGPTVRKEDEFDLAGAKAEYMKNTYGVGA